MDLKNIENVLMFGASQFVMPKVKALSNEPFMDTTSIVLLSILAVVVIIVLVLVILSLVATYRITGKSGAHVVLCFFFGVFYMSIMWLYHGIVGDKLVKRK